jgi:hypothetical protein
VRCRDYGGVNNSIRRIAAASQIAADSEEEHREYPTPTGDRRRVERAGCRGLRPLPEGQLLSSDGATGACLLPGAGVCTGRPAVRAGGSGPCARYVVLRAAAVVQHARALTVGPRR